MPERRDLALMICGARMCAAGDFDDASICTGSKPEGRRSAGLQAPLKIPVDMLQAGS